MYGYHLGTIGDAPMSIIYHNVAGLTMYMSRVSVCINSIKVKKCQIDQLIMWCGNKDGALPISYYTIINHSKT